MQRARYLVLGLLFFTGTVFAQGPGGKHNPEAKKQIEAAHIAWMTNELKLTPDEAAHFWPLWNNYQGELQPLIRLRRQSHQKGQENNANELEIEGKVLEIRKRYQKEFKKVIPDQRAMSIFRADREFQDQLIKQLGRRKKQ